jgi:hypothetical protein
MNTVCRRVPITILAGLSLLVSGCVEQRDVVAPELSASAAVASAAPRLPNATYAMTLNPGDVPPFFPPEIIDLIVGDYELDLNDPSAYIVRLNGEVVVEGRYTSNPARLVMRDTGGPFACLDEPGMAQGVYAWSLDNEELTLTVVQDHCFGRAFVQTVKPWQKQ